MRWILMVLVMGCGGRGLDSAEAWAAECEAVECPTASSQEQLDGGDYQSVTCRWNCTEHHGQLRTVTRTWMRDADECFALELESVEDCS